MKFQLEKLVIWPRKSDLFPPREIYFELGKINVITGASRTGKSAIIPIIDYCLGAGTCSIPIEVIRDNALWYGVVIALDKEKVLLARKVPNGQRPSTEYYVQRGQVVVTPTKIDNSNQTLDGVKVLLDSISKVPYCNRDEEVSGFNARLSFRDLTHLIFQSQDIVASQNILFYKTHEFEHREKLKRWFPFILGAETAEVIWAQQELREVEAELKRRQKEFDRAKNVSNEWLQNLVGQINVAVEYGLYNGSLQPSEMEQTQLILIAKEILSSELQSPKTSVESLSKSAAEVQKLKRKEAELSEQIATINKRLKDIGNLESSLGGFQESAKRKIERLSISDWLRDNKQPPNVCPICGGTEHSAANKEIEKICTAVREYEIAAAPTLELPAAFQREKTELKKELGELIEQLKAIQSRFDILRAADEETAKHHQQMRDMAIFVGQLKSTVALVERLSDNGDLNFKIQELLQRKAKLTKQIAASNTRSRMERALAELSILTLERLKTLDVEENYKSTTPKFNVNELAIQVMGTDGDFHWLAEVGSASNWVSFHLAFSCALQEFLYINNEQVSSVPSFMVFDQPSQVYFPKIHKSENDEEVDPQLEKDEDVAAVKKMFLTLSDSIRGVNGAWQAIVLDHARSDVYGNIDNVVQIQEWRNGEKLIPESWYQE